MRERERERERETADSKLSLLSREDMQNFETLNECSKCTVHLLHSFALIYEKIGEFYYFTKIICLDERRDGNNILRI